jgi:hypothetical protein
MRHTFQSFWIGNKISPYEALALRSFIDYGHSFVLYCYSSRLNVPKGVELRDASTILAKDQCFAYKSGFGQGSFAACSNLFRYLLLQRSGGWWVDTDVICLTDRIPSYPCFFAYEDSDFINGAVLYFEPGDRLVEQCLNEALRVGRNVTWGEIGPRLLTRKAKALHRFSQAQAQSTCYPLHWSAALQLLDPRKTGDIASATGSSLMLHLWNEIFRQAAICKDFLPPEGSYLGMLAKRHPVKGWRGEYLLPDEQGAAVPGALMKAKLPVIERVKHWTGARLGDGLWPRARGLYGYSS